MLQDDLRVPPWTAQRYMRLARNPRFAKNDNLSLLPQKFAALVALADVPEAILDAGIASGEIGPDTTQKKARQFVTVKVTHENLRIVSPVYRSQQQVPERVVAPYYKPPPSPGSRSIEAIAKALATIEDHVDGDVFIALDEMKPSARQEFEEQLARALACLDALRQAPARDRSA